MTRRTPNVRLRADEPLDVEPSDAAALGLRDGDPVQITSRFGRAVLPARITTELEPGQVFSGFHFPAAGVNELTSPLGDDVTDCPEYKVTAVRLRPLPAPTTGGTP
jgi:formate dehydrogenase major subunit